MASDLLSIARSGAQAARIALDITGQNIANASTEGYVRRTANLAEVAASGGALQSGDVSLSGVRLASVVRNADPFRQSEVRRTGSDAARAQAEVDGLQNVQSAVEQANIYPSITAFEGALQQLSANPVDPSLRAATLESARTLVGTLNLASQELGSAQSGLQFQASDGVTQVNAIGQQLARTNLSLARSGDATSDRSALLDQRDKLLQQLSGYADVTTTFAADGTVGVQLGGLAGPALVTGGASATLTMTNGPTGIPSFAIGAAPVTLGGGSLAGQGQALSKLADIKTGLDSLANTVVTTVNAAQATGVALDGTPGQPLLSGNTAGTIALTTSDGSKIATAPAGSVANSRDPGNLTAMRSAIASADPAGKMDALLYDISSTVAGRTVTRDALNTIANTAKTSLDAQSGVDLDREAVNLVRYQQAFQASGKAMQVASTLFDTLLAIR
ncbi:flagellar hook-associated protein FlgK [Novosphingobium lentum]|uniref:flagellar hook-associated protein FlgK n=1 Tax=Novosphingobium lentum TaxID=145287 RepID=UPI0008344D90|nr:flagellar hook-associated protein FlgK [Novosphingobium lentum]